MMDISKSLLTALKHFSQYQKTLETLFQRNDSFRTLCEDFHECIKAVEYWCDSPPDKNGASTLCEEYKSLYADLKGEIARTLEDLEEDVQLD
jgi:hypothetical protein